MTRPPARRPPDEGRSAPNKPAQKDRKGLRAQAEPPTASPDAVDRRRRSAPGASARRPAVPRPSREQYRRRRLAAALAALLLLVGLGLTGRVLLYDAGLADVEDVQVTGLSTVPQADVLAAAAVVPGGPLADVDTGGIAARVVQLPAVASVQVGRGWPHTVTVEVTERVPVATATGTGGVALVDRLGVLYPGTPPPGLPRLTFGAVGPDDPSTRAALASLQALPDPVRAQVLTIDVTVAGVGVPGQVAFGLTDARQIRWGTPERSAEKAAVLTPLLTQDGHVYDVTSPDLPTIRR